MEGMGNEVGAERGVRNEERKGGMDARLADARPIHPSHWGMGCKSFSWVD